MTTLTVTVSDHHKPAPKPGTIEYRQLDWLDKAYIQACLKEVIADRKAMLER